MSPLPDGFEVPIHRSLTEPLLIAGLPRTFAFVLWTFAIVVIVGLGQVWYVPLQLLLHVLFAYLTKREPYFFDIGKRALRAQRRLDP
jgi:type IV secretion system protein VirB3